MHLRVLLIVFVLSIACGLDRKIKVELNPGCEGCTKQKTVVYIRADGLNDTMHLIWDFTNGVPTMVLLIADINSTMTIKWSGTNVSDAILNGSSKYGLVNFIYKLYEYNDTEDIGYMTPGSPYRFYSLEDITWTRVNNITTDKEAILRIDGHFKHRAGTVEVKLQYLPFTDYATELPHLIHTANSTLVDISLVNLTTSRDYNSSRFAVNMVLLTTDIQQADDLHFITRKSLDDEHTPGVFEIIEIKTPKSYTGDEGGFLQFRPVGYTDPKREVSSSTNVHMSSFNSSSVSTSLSKLRMSALGKHTNWVLGDQTFVSLGMSGDGFYKKHNYTAWSFTAGYGAPPVEGFSLFVVVIISIGLGVPVLLALSGIIYAIVRRYKQRNAPQRFTDDE